MKRLLLALAWLLAAPAWAANVTCGGVDDTALLNTALAALPNGGLLTQDIAPCRITGTLRLIL